MGASGSAFMHMMCRIEPKWVARSKLDNYAIANYIIIVSESLSSFPQGFLVQSSNWKLGIFSIHLERQRNNDKWIENNHLTILIDNTGILGLFFKQIHWTVRLKAVAYAGKFLGVQAYDRPGSGSGGGPPSDAGELLKTCKKFP